MTIKNNPIKCTKHRILPWQGSASFAKDAPYSFQVTICFKSFNTDNILQGYYPWYEKRLEAIADFD